MKLFISHVPDASIRTISFPKDKTQTPLPSHDITFALKKFYYQKDEYLIHFFFQE